MMFFLISLGMAFPMEFSGRNGAISLDGISFRGERFSWNGMELHLDGLVSIDYEDLRIKSQELTLNFNEERELLSMSVVGSVELERKDWRGYADKILWSKNDPWITMHGKAVLNDAKWEFRGSRISFSIETDQIECQRECSIRVKPNP